MNKRFKLLSRFVIVILALSMIIGSTGVAFADKLPYVTYNFDYWEDVVYTPAAYVPSDIISAKSLGLDTTFGEIRDLYCDTDLGVIILSDRTNSKIYVVSGEDFSLITVLDEFFNTETGQYDKLSGPNGVCISKLSSIAAEENVSSTRQLYVCDTGNSRLLYFDIKGSGKNISFSHAGHIESSMLKSDILKEGYTFNPIRVCVDSADRIYIINEHEFQGILQLEKDGQFNGFFGTINVNISLWQKIWKTLSTKEQKNRSTLYIPTEYTGIDLDDSGFLFACYTDQTGQKAVMRLNSKGQNVIRTGANMNVGGDVMKTPQGSTMYSGFSRAIDVKYSDKGMYSMLDRLRGRIFTYDSEGNMLYIFGGIGNVEGTFTSPYAIESYGDLKLVTDILSNQVQIFAPTEYGRLINEAVGYRYDGDESKAVSTWQKVLKLNENFEQAYIGIGKAYLNSGEYKKAMDYLGLGMSRSYYSIAYKRYRNNIIKSHFNAIFGCILILLVAFIVSRLYKKHKNRKDDY